MSDTRKQAAEKPEGERMIELARELIEWCKARDVSLLRLSKLLRLVSVLSGD